MTIHIDTELGRALAALSEIERVEPGEVIRRAVIDRSERSAHEIRVAESASRAMDRWGDVLRRLGTE